jgi:hypothetical protein
MKSIIIEGKAYKLIAFAQSVGDGLGWFKYRNLYEPLNPEVSAFRERVSVALTGSIDAEKSRYLDHEKTIRKHSVDHTGIYDPNIGEPLTGIELYLISKGN